MKTSLRYLGLPILAFGMLSACGPAPNTGSSPSPTTTPTATQGSTVSPSAAPTPTAPVASPAPMATGTPYPNPSPASSAQPSAQPSATPMASASATAMPTAAPTNAATPTPDLHELRDNFFKNYGINPFVEAATDPLSTFAADVDTASYAVARGYLNSGQLPPTAAIRTEEFLNAFDYHYPQPINGKFAIHTDLAPSYFGDTSTKLMRVGIQGQEVLDKNRKQANLTFALDVSGSMNQENRLELVKQSLNLLLNSLHANDKVGIVIYGTTARVLLEPTDLSNKALISSVIANLRPEGSTNAEAGLQLAYAQANKAFVPGAINRVILCSDGVANVGDTGPDAILATIKARATSGITLTTLGFGMKGYNDTLMEQLANQGDGNYGYIDSIAEARTLLVDQLTSTLQVIAKDAKIQVAFNPGLVDQYRLLGYENRDIADQDFRNDRVDAGEIGSNHSVTALYEVRFKPDVSSGQVATITLRYKDVDENDAIKELSSTVTTDAMLAFSKASGSFRLATAVAEFAEILRQSIFARTGKLSEVADLARTAQTAYPTDTKIQEFLTLGLKAAQLQKPSTILNTDEIVDKSENPQMLPEWQSFLLKQLGGKSQK